MRVQHIHGFTVDTKRPQHAPNAPVYYGFAVIVQAETLTAEHRRRDANWPFTMSLLRGSFTCGGATTDEQAIAIARSAGLYETYKEALAAGIAEAARRHERYNAKRVKQGRTPKEIEAR